MTRVLNRSYIKVAGVDFGKTPGKTFVANLARRVPGATIELRLDRIDGPVIGSMTFDQAGPTGQWQEEVIPVSGATGQRDLYMIFTGPGDASLFDFDYWRFAH